MVIGATIDNEGGSVDLNKKMKDFKKEEESLECSVFDAGSYGQVIFD